MKHLKNVVVSMLLGFATTGCAHAPAMDKEGIEPEASTGIRDLELVQGDRQMVSSADPSASHAGMEILAAGGSATDALIGRTSFTPRALRFQIPPRYLRSEAWDPSGIRHGDRMRWGCGIADAVPNGRAEGFRPLSDK